MAKQQKKTAKASASNDGDIYKTGKSAVAHVMAELERIDRGHDGQFDFMSSGNVGAFCKAVGMKESWAGKTIAQLAPAGLLDAEACGAEDSRIILDIIMGMIKEDMFRNREDSKPFDKTILNDFLKKNKKGFAGEPTLGHFWEWRYALAVELEHGRTRGTNVTNNHPLLTGLVVMAHLAEDKLYYPRLLCMELEGELTNAVLEEKPAREIGDYATRLERARLYLTKRIHEKLKPDFEMPE